jgi:hypothetical protein
MLYLLCSVKVKNRKNKQEIVSKANRGFFSSEQEALLEVLVCPDCFADSGYFNYFVIEERQIDALDDFDFKSNWYQIYYTPFQNPIVKKIEAFGPLIDFTSC